MSDQADNTRVPEPPRTPGESANRPENAVPEGMVVFSPRGGGSEPLSMGKAVAWCVAAGACAGIMPLIAPLFVGLGYAVLAGAGGMRERVLAAACCVIPAVLIALLLQFAGVVDALIACIVGVVGSHLYLRGKLTPGTACISVALVAALFFAFSEAAARLAGTTLADQFALAIDAYLDGLKGLSIDADLQVARVRTLIDAIWPTAFVMIVFIGFVPSIMGAKIGARRQGIDVGRDEPFELFDLPLWVVGALIASIAILALRTVFPAYAHQLLMVGATLLVSLRLAFAMQGGAVLSWFKRTRGWRGLFGAVITVVALYLELNLFVLTIVGILDIWMNMRRLNRGGRVTVQTPDDRS